MLHKQTGIFSSPLQSQRNLLKPDCEEKTFDLMTYHVKHQNTGEFLLDIHYALVDSRLNIVEGEGLLGGSTKILSVEKDFPQDFFSP